jgi:HD-like signal output (HDOD) protein/CheY-like chemotaxis protein
MAESEEKTLLFVDDERSVLSSIRRLLRREGWNLLFAESAVEGMEVLRQNSVDLVVSDMRMPQIDGATFLKRLRQDYPHTVRIILTGYADRASVSRAFSDAEIHELVSKPWDDEELKQILRNALDQSAGQDGEIPGLHAIINEIESLPPLPHTYAKVRQALREAEANSLEPVAEVIMRDPSLAARLLQVANSSFFGQRREVDTVNRALFVLGLQMVENLVLATNAFDTLDFDGLPNLTAKELWKHSLACGAIARHIAERQHKTAERQHKPKSFQETAMLAGTLHDLGKLVLAKYVAKQYSKVLLAAHESQDPLFEIERQLLGTDHSAIGGHLAEWWNLPPKIVEAVRWHHAPNESKMDTRLTHLVHLSNALAHQLELGSSGPKQPISIDEHTYKVLDLSHSEIEKILDELREKDIAAH